MSEILSQEELDLLLESGDLFDDNGDDIDNEAPLNEELIQKVNEENDNNNVAENIFDGLETETNIEELGIEDNSYQYIEEDVGVTDDFSIDDNQEEDDNSLQRDVHPVSFQSFEDEEISAEEKENISLIMDVPLEVSVELGRAERKVREILELVPGSIIELDKLAGEPIDILVNGKIIAKGEVVVVDENFGVRITDIINVKKRL